MVTIVPWFGKEVVVPSPYMRSVGCYKSMPSCLIVIVYCVHMGICVTLFYIVYVVTFEYLSHYKSL
jgi:hypothetical protein